jgi:hypothetical protein
MRLAVQVLGIPVIASACGAVGFAIASAAAEFALARIFHDQQVGSLVAEPVVIGI